MRIGCRLLLVLTLCVFSRDAIAQADSSARIKLAANAILVDLGGQGGILSCNYERFVNDYFAIKIGLGFVPDLGHGGSIAIGNAMINLVTGRRSVNSHLELGLGIMHAFDDISLASGTIGYRYQRPSGGEIFRLAFTPMYGPKGFHSYGLIGLGFTF